MIPHSTQVFHDTSSSSQKYPSRFFGQFLWGMIAAALLCGGTATSARAADPVALEVLLDATLKKLPAETLHRSALGVSRKDRPVWFAYHRADLDFFTPKRRIVLLGGWDGSSASVQQILSFAEWFYASPEAAPYRERFVVSIVPCLAPDAYAAQGDDPVVPAPAGSNGTFPPPEPAYAAGAEAAYLWRWLGMFAPDVVISVETLPKDGTAKILSGSDESLPEKSLVRQLRKLAPSNTGSLFSFVWQAPLADDPATSVAPLPALLQDWAQTKDLGPSPARRELQTRLARSPREVAETLTKVYGRKLPAVEYIPALAVLGRLELARLTNDATVAPDVEKIVAPYREGRVKALEKSSGSLFAGHLLFSYLAKTANNPRDLELAVAAANMGFDAAGKPKPSMPSHSEMSDAVFMGCPILAEAGLLTGDPKYYEQALRHFRFMKKLDLRKDGIYRHSPLDEAAWGRGNGFPALGLTLTLSAWPSNLPNVTDQPNQPGPPGREELLAELKAHLTALKAHQDPTGCWRQIIDDPASYRELTATCMIGFAMQRGIRLGWFTSAEFGPAADRAWAAVKTRVARDGTLVDVCTGTGKQATHRDYYDRPAILGRDDRGGAMSLLFAVERFAAELEQKLPPNP